ncbi:LysR substrate-binding domain-containing protein [Maritimibacter sp. UBA3975]|uniref:LysR substrate-binding domain-containing protein n=1 Tax=Maritimibacter sp. UBA3975 TaxID=1946833 RepID=UPI0025C5B7A7|nr:LysR substrate-binding domain-containing protein [Maritimibacter sp. UBA3975]
MIDKRLKMRHLRCFQEVVRQRGIVRAAEALSTSQPAVSRTISDLETILDVKLLDRRRKAFELTPEGREFNRLISSGLHRIEEAVETASGERPRGDSVACGVLPTYEAQYFPQVVARFKAEVPNTTLTVLRGTNLELMDKLRAGSIDFVVGRMAHGEAMRGLSFEHLYSEPILCVVRKDHPLRRRPIGDFRSLLEFGIMLNLQGTIPRHEVDRILLANGISDIPDLVETDSADFARDFLRATDYVWLIPQGVVQRELSAGEFVTLEGLRFDTLGPVGLTVLPDRQMNAAASRLIEMIRDAVPLPTYQKSNAITPK